MARMSPPFCKWPEGNSKEGKLLQTVDIIPSREEMTLETKTKASRNRTPGRLRRAQGNTKERKSRVIYRDAVTEAIQKPSSLGDGPTSPKMRDQKVLISKALEQSWGMC